MYYWHEWNQKGSHNMPEGSHLVVTGVDPDEFTWYAGRQSCSKNEMNRALGHLCAHIG